MSSRALFLGIFFWPIRENIRKLKTIKENVAYRRTPRNFQNLIYYFEKLEGNWGRVRLGSIRNKNIGIIRVSVCLGAILIPE